MGAVFHHSSGITAVAGTATVFVVFRIARRLWDDTTGLVAALFVALAFLHVRDSHYGTTDVVMTFLLVLSVSFLINGHMTRRRWDFVVGGLAGGLAAATKYNALLLIVPLFASYLLNIVDARDAQERHIDMRLFLYGIPFLMMFAIGVPFLALDLPRFLEDMKLLGQSMETGSRGLELSHGWLHHLEYSLRYGLGLPLLVSGVAGLLMLLAVERRAAVVVLLSFPIAYYLVAGSIRNLFFRYAIPLVPFLCLAAARLVTWAVPFSSCPALAGRWCGGTYCPALAGPCTAGP